MLCIHSFRYIFSFRSSSIHVDKYYIEKQHFHTRTRITTLKIFSRNAIQSVGMQFYGVIRNTAVKRKPAFLEECARRSFSILYAHVLCSFLFLQYRMYKYVCIYIKKLDIKCLAAFYKSHIMI